MSPESNGATIAGIVIGGLSFLAGIIAAIFGTGKKWQTVENSLKRSHERHDAHDKKFSDLAAMFLPNNGVPTFVPTVICAGEREDCRKDREEKFADGAERFDKIEKKIDELQKAQYDNFQKLISAIQASK